VVTDSTGCDLLVGTRAAYSSEVSVDRWAEQTLYRADWDEAGMIVGRLPMWLYQARDKKAQGRGRGCGACVLPN
jgi:hypothetical protein